MASARQLLRVLCARSLSSLVGRTACQTRVAGLHPWRPVSTASCSRWRQREPMLASRAPRVPSAAAGLGHRWSSGVSLTLPELEEQVLSVLKMFDKVKPDQVTLEAHFVNDLGMDSLDAVEVVMAFEDEFGCEITDEEAEKIFCAKDAVELLKTKLDVH